jgi:hypothetical protein
VGIKKSVILVLNNKKTSTVVSDNALGVSKANLLVTSSPTSVIVSRGSIRKGVVRPNRITSTFVSSGGLFVDLPLQDEYVISDELQKVADLIRNLDDQILNSDLLTLVLEKEFDDIDFLEDLIAIAINKPIDDISENFDLLNYIFDKQVSDILLVADETVVSLSKVLQDDVIQADILQNTLIKSFTDNIDLSDVVNLTAQKILQEILSFTDSESKDVSKNLDHISTALDQSSSSFDKLILDLIQLFDQINITTNKNFEETVVSSSEGSLISQGYTEDNTYFLEDYVGDSRTFS